MKKSLLALLVAAPLTLSLTGCIVVAGDDDGRGYSIADDFKDREYHNRKKIARIELGASFNSVESMMGVADFTETYEKNGDMIKVLFYRTQRVHKDDLTTRDECTYLYFVNGELRQTGRGGDFSRNTGH